jgi:hypothetical protein
MGGARIAWAALGLSAALAVSGCGPSPSASAGGPAPDDNTAPAQTAAVAAPDACTLLTEAIAKKYLGAAAQLKPEVHPNPRTSQCQWADDHGAITLQAGPWDTVYAKSGEDRLAGFGDESYDTPSGLYVREGDVGVGISVIIGDGASWAAAADSGESRAVAAEHEVAPDIMAKF